MLRPEHQLGADRHLRAAGQGQSRAARDLEDAVRGLAVEDVGRAQKARDEEIVGPLVELHRRADLADGAGFHHGDAVADGVGFLLVVGDEDGRQPQPLLQGAQVAAHADPHLGVEVAERLVEQQHLGLDGDGAGDGDALLLAARKLGRPAVGVGGEADQLQRLGHLGVDLATRQAAFLEAEGDVLGHRHVRPQRVALEHHADVALPWRQAGDVLAVEQHLARLRLGEARDQPQQGGLAAARGAEKGEELAGPDRKIDALQDVRGPVAQVHAANVDADRLGHRAAHISRPRARCERSTASCDRPMQIATMTTAMTPMAAPAPRPAGVCIST